MCSFSYAYQDPIPSPGYSVNLDSAPALAGTLTRTWVFRTNDGKIWLQSPTSNRTSTFEVGKLWYRLSHAASLLGVQRHVEIRWPSCIYRLIRIAGRHFARNAVTAMCSFCFWPPATGTGLVALHISPIGPDPSTGSPAAFGCGDANRWIAQK